MRQSLAPVLLLLSACCGIEPDLRSAEPYERYLGIRELTDRRDAEGMREVVRGLEDPHFLVVVGGLEVLGEIGHKEFLQHVLPQFRHRHPLVRAQACATLAMIRNEEGIPALVDVLKDPDPVAKRAAVKALRSFAPRPEALRALVDGVGDKEPSVSLLSHEALQSATGRVDVGRARDAWARAVQ